MLQFSDRRRKPMMHTVIQPQRQQGYQYTQNRKMPQQDQEGKKEINRWGQPTWLMLHTLAEKVRDSSFFEIRKELLNLIYMICNNLPCPTCRNHAVEYLNSVNYNTITTKRQLKIMLFQFHNSVNVRKNYPLFPLEELDSKYASAVTSNIIQHFIYYFGQKYFSNRLSADGFHRKMFLENLSKWFQTNIHHFNV